MCGIVGYFAYSKSTFGIDVSAFDAIIDSLSHRGPDARGRFQENGIGLGHRRLTILDLNERANQPMFSPDRKVALVFNGEIYNFLELRKSLERLNHVFVTTCDTEVIVHAYLEWGVACVDRFNGIFSFGIWDSRDKSLWLVRDHMGVKPLFYADVNGVLYFASEPGALLKFPQVSNEIDPLGLDCYFTFSYIPAPFTGYKQIRQIEPGCWLLCKNGSITKRKYWQIPIGSKKLKMTEGEMVAEFDRLLTSAVKSQMVSDVPLGAFLSGGTDSFAIVRAMHDAGCDDVTAFSIGFLNPAYDELPQAKIAAKALNAKLISKTMPGIDQTLYQNVQSHCVEPFADSSSLPMYFLCSVASEKVSVALSGDGADELLGGYPVYNIGKYANFYRSIPFIVRKLLITSPASVLPDAFGKYSLKEKAGRFLYGAESGPVHEHAAWRIIFTAQIKKMLYTPEFLKEVRDFDPLELYYSHVLKASKAGCCRLDSLLYADQAFYLPNDMLVKVDRMSMAHGLEVRVPFLDLDIVNFTWRLPVEMKIHAGNRKYILKRTIEDRFPSALQRMPKSGFNMEYDTSLQAVLPSGNHYIRSGTWPSNAFFSRYHRFLVEYALAVANPILS